MCATDIDDNTVNFLNKASIYPKLKALNHKKNNVISVISGYFIRDMTKILY